jgi:colanic acid biosynthesis glycosyl transferase WcaI
LFNDQQLCPTGRNGFDTRNGAEHTSAGTTRVGTVRVAFTGNVGRFQGLETFIEGVRLATASLPASSLEVLIVGNGDSVARLKTTAGNLSSSVITFLPHQPASSMHALLQSVDLAVVSLMPGVIRSAYPSKLMSYLRAGCRVLAIVDSDSELSKLIQVNDLGIVCEPGDTLGVARCLAEEAGRNVASNDRRRIESFAANHFGIDETLAAWTALYARLAGQPQ